MSSGSNRDAVISAAKRLGESSPGSEVVLSSSDDLACPADAVPLAAMADFHRRRGVRVGLDCPDGSAASRVFAGFISGRLSPEPMVGTPFGRVWRFSSSDEQNSIVNAMTLQLAKSALLGKGVKEAFIWCLNEVMDNVLTHSAGDEAIANGYVMATVDSSTSRLKVCVFDLGIGLKDSFAGSRYSPADDAEAIKLALKANVTSGIGQGNGLWGLHELIRRAKNGSLSVASGSARYLFMPRDGVDSVAPFEPWAGFKGTTLVDFRMSADGDLAIDDVFGESFTPVDLWQEAHETDTGTVRLGVLELAGGSGSRGSAAEVRRLAENAIENDGKCVELDFSGVAFCSSAFIDELVGKLFVKYGFLKFMQCVRLLNVQGLSAQLVNHSLMQRMKGN